MSAATKSGEGPVTVLIGTRKGAFTLTSDADRGNWKISEPTFLGHIIHHFKHDTRSPHTMLIAAKTGHLGPTVFRTVDGGTTWKEASTPPAFPRAAEGEKGRVVSSVFWLSQGHESEPGVWYAGTTPAGLFRTTDAGDTWEPVKGFNEGPNYKEWTSGGETPGGQILHSVLIDSRDPDRMYLSISVGGTFFSIDKGETWAPLNKGIAADFLPSPDVEFGHDPHCVVFHPANPDRLYQQNHCGIYRLDRPDDKWQRIGTNMPSHIGDIGFPIVVHPDHVDWAWVFPMDGTTVWPRTSPDGKPAVYNTRDGGNSWTRQDSGLPEKDAYFTVKRQAMATDDCRPLGLYFGTSSGEVWGSQDEGETWKCLVRYLPEIYSISVMQK